jgi:two-component sensor histidine kinase
MPKRLAEYDVSRPFLSHTAKLTAQVLFGIVCAFAMIGLREVLDLWAPVSGPFALVYPTVLLATLYGHWRAGLAALGVAFVWAWWFVLPVQFSFAFLDTNDPARVIINAVAALVVIGFAEVFRGAAHSTMEEIRAAAQRRLTLLAELEHRTKNNFALVASLLEMQKHQLRDPGLQGPLDDAVNRVRTFASAYSELALEQEEGSEVAMKPYIDLLIDRIERAAFGANVTVHREIEDIVLPREVGIAIGLYLNEALSNCAKYAFPEGAPGTVLVAFNTNGGEWTLVVEDDGIGAAMKGDHEQAGLGTSLMEAFAMQAGANQVATAPARGHRVELHSH